MCDTGLSIGRDNMVFCRPEDAEGELCEVPCQAGHYPDDSMADMGSRIGAAHDAYAVPAGSFDGSIGVCSLGLCCPGRNKCCKQQGEGVAFDREVCKEAYFLIFYFTLNRSFKNYRPFLPIFGTL